MQKKKSICAAEQWHVTNSWFINEGSLDFFTSLFYFFVYLFSCFCFYKQNIIFYFSLKEKLEFKLEFAKYPYSVLADKTAW